LQPVALDVQFNTESNEALINRLAAQKRSVSQARQSRRLNRSYVVLMASDKARWNPAEANRASIVAAEAAPCSAVEESACNAWSYSGC